ncbi:phasin family protein [Noviherbaspirillum saxi]|uniref:Phasin family protein n=1 Tax=Noviherbaspirillum saxi TaxID=2320863 RepID=A0A3A3G7M3_9BURK|nr:phasin family protein [Noviherbaspirillum saxi]RJF96180.1 phasin family protein [Noviherbaspirillum saxi]
MFIFSQPLPPSAKAHLEAQFTFISELSKQLFNTAQKINELNIQVAQTVMNETLSSTREVFSAQNPYEALSIAASQVPPAAEKLRAYQQQLTDIAARTQVDLAKTAETHVPATARTASALADEVARRANEETQKATQRQKATLDKLATPIGKPEGGKGVGANVH